MRNFLKNSNMDRRTKQIIFTRGLPGSGKSTWAKQWALTDAKTRVRISNDDIRRMLGKYWEPQREPLVFKIQKDAIIDALREGYDIVVDEMNLTRIDSYIMDCIRRYDYSVCFEDFLTDEETCIAVDSKRPGDANIGVNVIHNLALLHKDFLNGERTCTYTNGIHKLECIDGVYTLVDIDKSTMHVKINNLMI